MSGFDSHASTLWSVTKVLLLSFVRPVHPELQRISVFAQQFADLLLCESISCDSRPLVLHPVFYSETPWIHGYDWKWLNADAE